jgi:hypothetical protein
MIPGNEGECAVVVVIRGTEKECAVVANRAIKEAAIKNERVGRRNIIRRV